MPLKRTEYRGWTLAQGCGISEHSDCTQLWRPKKVGSGLPGLDLFVKIQSLKYCSNWSWKQVLRKPAMASFDIGEHPGCRAISVGHGVFPYLYTLWPGWVCASCLLGGREHAVSSSSYWGDFNTCHFWVNMLSPFLLGLNLHWFLSGLFSLLNHKGLSKVNGAYWNSQQWEQVEGVFPEGGWGAEAQAGVGGSTSLLMETWPQTCLCFP